jgi:two-component system CheB/CheR fusion protein
MEASRYQNTQELGGRPEIDQVVSRGAGGEGEMFVVALGASAGGLEALEKFFDNMPVDSGLALVVVQHLSPDFKSLMDELLARHTKLTIHRVTDGMPIEPNSIYLIPPKKEMIASGGKLLLTDKDPSQGLSLPIDTFLRSLANEFGPRAIAVILSGTGSDGSRGIRAVHDAGGFVVVQDEASANFDGMPRSAIETGVVDAVLPPREMAAAIRRHVHGLPDELADLDAEGVPLNETGINEIFRALRDAYAIDFSLYKPNTVARRVERRLQLNGALDLDQYVSRLRHDRDELNSLYKDFADRRDAVLPRCGSVPPARNQDSSDAVGSRHGGRGTACVDRRMCDGRRSLLGRHLDSQSPLGS